MLLYCFNPMLGQIGKSLVLNGCTDFLEIPENDVLDYNNTLSIENMCGDKSRKAGTLTVQ